MADRSSAHPGSRGSSLRDRDSSYHQHHHHHRHHHHRRALQHHPSRPDPDSCTYKLKELGRKTVAFLFGHVGICCLVVGYIIMGAFAFMAIESEDTKRRYEDVVRLREQTIQNLWNITNELNVLYPEEWNSSVALQVLNFQRKIVQFVLEGYDGKSYGNHTLIRSHMEISSTASGGGDHEDGAPIVVESAGAWSFSASFLYCLTVITTIGYGNIAPRTMMGKLVTIAYAMVGMPLFLLYVSNMGDFLATCFRWVYVHLCKCSCLGRPRRLQHQHAQLQQQNQFQRAASIRRTRSIRQQDQQQYDPSSSSSVIHHRGRIPASGDPELFELQVHPNPMEDFVMDDALMMGIHQQPPSAMQPDYQTVTVPITVSLMVMVSYIIGGAVLFKQWESEWGYLDGSYFCFISLSTTGFGDLVPGDSLVNSGGGVLGGAIELSLIFCSMYLIIGMALIAMCFNLMQEEVIAKFRKAGRLFGCIRQEED